MITFHETPNILFIILHVERMTLVHVIFILILLYRIIKVLFQYMVIAMSVHLIIDKFDRNQGFFVHDHNIFDVLVRVWNFCFCLLLQFICNLFKVDFRRFFIVILAFILFEACILFGFLVFSLNKLLVLFKFLFHIFQFITIFESMFGYLFFFVFLLYFFIFVKKLVFNLVTLITNGVS